MGQIKRHRSDGNQWRKKNWKKAIVKLDYEIDNEFR